MMTDAEEEADALRRFAASVASVFPMKSRETFDAYCERTLDLKPSQRAMLAARLVEVGREIAAEKRANKNAWIVAARIEFSPGRRTPCHVCGRFRDITHAHHVVPLAAQYDRGFKRPDHEHVWLCPNHHAILHLLIPSEGPQDLQKLGARGAGPILEMSHDEIDATLKLITRSGRDYQ